MHIILALIIFIIKSTNIYDDLNKKYNEEEIDYLNIQNLPKISERNEYNENNQYDWNDYLFKDEYNIEEDFEGMFKKYNCNNVISINESICDVDEFCINIKIDSLDINLKKFNNEDVINFEVCKKKKLININSPDVVENYNEYAIIHNNIKQLSNCDYFIYLFNKIENDLKNILNNLIKYLYTDNDCLKNAKLDLEQNYDKTYKIKRFLIISNVILDNDFIINNLNNSEKVIYFNKILKTKYTKKECYKHLREKFKIKYNSLNSYMEKKTITIFEIFNYTRFLLIITKDLHIKKLLY
ncbi:hypothetical protein NAPIS_ORF01841 [Vairimorpha apis BRL 01]|uniref:Uncharacterized protein n=1 Tax=Vairimorpha apis BRL 01 TaxID=1037528 RepID=T0L7W1_9MICR|nr:hypothetical protein NAPIS_ORF01841 [Vairimorpha apis BRL 01]